MRVEVVHPDTGERYVVDIPALQPADLDRMINEFARDEAIRSYIEKLPISAEIKAFLFKLSKFTLKVGETIIKLGKKLLEIAIMLVTKYKGATIGLIVGALLTVVIGIVPVLGPPLSSFLGTLLMLFGFTKGLWDDLKTRSPELAASVVEAGEVFRPLGAGTQVG